MRPFEAASETPARRGWWAGSGWQPRYVRAARAGPGLRRAAAPAWWCRCRSAGCPARTGKREAEEAPLRPGAAGLFGDGAQRSAAGRGQPHGGIAGVAAPRGRLSPRQDGPRPGRAEQSCPAELGRAANGVPAAGPAPRLGGGTARFPVSAARLRRLTWALVPGLFRLSTAVPSAMTIVTAAPGPGCGGAGRGGGRGAGASCCWAGRGEKSRERRWGSGLRRRAGAVWARGSEVSGGRRSALPVRGAPCRRLRCCRRSWGLWWDSNELGNAQVMKSAEPCCSPPGCGHQPSPTVCGGAGVPCGRISRGPVPLALVTVLPVSRRSVSLPREEAVPHSVELLLSAFSPGWS